VSVSAASFGRLSQGELHEEGLDEGLHDELGPGAVAPAQWWTGSPTFPSPALASASLAAASRACARVGSGDIKQNYRSLRRTFPIRRNFVSSQPSHLADS
jgi:hypothetical protein